MTKLFLPVKSTKGKAIADINNLSEIYLERRFGKTLYFILVNSDTKEYNLIKNSNKHQGGNDHTPDIVKKSGAEVVLSAHMGEGAYNGIKKQKISILRGELNTPVSILVDKYNSGLLKEFTTPKVHEHDHDHVHH